MEYSPELTGEEVKEVHKRFDERQAVYRDRGLDFNAFREFILDKAAPLEDGILELGTGTGYTTLSLAREGYRFVSIDTDKEAIKTTAARLAYDKVLPNVQFHVMDAARLDFGDGSFKSVIAVNLLHHVSDTGKLLFEADRVLKPGGKVVISDFNEEGRRIIDAVHAEEGRTHDHPMADRPGIRSFFGARGYKVREFESAGHWILIGEKQ